MIPRFKPWLGWGEFIALFRPNRGAVERFERKFATTFEATEALAFPYGRSALWAFLNAVGVKHAEVVMPAYTCSVVAHAISLSGNTPCFVDIRLEDYNMDLDLLPTAINERTRAIVATHLFGYPLDIDRVEAIVADAEAKYGHKIWLIQDCAHSFGASWKGRLLGTSGDVALYALNISKMMTAIFGGMLTFSDPELAARVRAWRDKNYQKPPWSKAWKRRAYLLAVFAAFNKGIYGFTYWLQTKTPLLKGMTDAYHLDDKIHFPPDFEDLMLNVEAEVGLVQLTKYPEIVARRRDVAKDYNLKLQGKPDWRLPPVVDGATYSHYVVMTNNRQRDKLAFNNQGIQLGELIQYVVPHLNSYRTPLSPDFSESQEASRKVINLPVFKNVIADGQPMSFDDHWAGQVTLPPAKLLKAIAWLKPALDEINASEHLVSILDAGCGNGVHATVLKNEAISELNYLGIDISGKAVEICKKSITDKRFNFLVGDISKLEKPPNSFNLVISYGVVSYTHDPAATLAELARITKPGGKVGLWFYVRPPIPRYLLLSLVRWIANLGGTRYKDFLANLIVPFLRMLPVTSGVNLGNATWAQCREVVRVNISPQVLIFPTKKTVLAWIGDAGLVVCSELSDEELNQGTFWCTKPISTDTDVMIT